MNRPRDMEFVGCGENHSDDVRDRINPQTK